MENTLKRVLAAALLVLLAVVSFVFIAERASAPETHAKTTASIDEKVETVMKLTATATLTSAGITALPGDAATPIAEKLADFTEYFLLVLTVLYAEKYLLTVLGAGAFKVLIPLACVLLGVSLFWANRRVRTLAARLALLALALYFVIPASITVSDLIYDAYRETIDTTVSSAQELTAEAEEASDGLLSQLAALPRKAADTLSRFVETLAVLIVTSCLIPLLVLVFFLWLIKQLMGADLMPMLPRSPFASRHVE